MRRALIATAALLPLVAPLLAAPVAMAQDARPGQTAGLRYLSWSGRATETAPPASSAAAGLRRPASIIPHAGTGAPPMTAASARVSQPRTPDRIARPGLTPASAWLAPTSPTLASPAPAAPASYSEAAPVMMADAPPPVVRPAPAPTLAPTPAPTRAPAPVAQPIAAQPAYQPEYLPEPSRPGVAAQPTPLAAVAGPTLDPSDPYAPRRDAPVFRMQQPAQGQPAAQTQPVAQAQATPQAQAAPQPVQPAAAGQTARYYSVHRQYGRQPDAVSMPAQGAVDVIQLTDTPTSSDLSEPQPGPTLMRATDGRLVPVPDQETP